MYDFKGMDVEDRIRFMRNKKPSAKKKEMAKKFHHPGTKYLPVHPIHRGEKKDE